MASHPVQHAHPQVGPGTLIHHTTTTTTTIALATAAVALAAAALSATTFATAALPTTTFATAALAAALRHLLSDHLLQRVLSKRSWLEPQLLR